MNGNRHGLPQFATWAWESCSVRRVTTFDASTREAGNSIHRAALQRVIRASAGNEFNYSRLWPECYRWDNRFHVADVRRVYGDNCMGTCKTPGQTPHPLDLPNSLPAGLRGGM